MVQKKALAIILANQYLSYEHALTLLNLERLDQRRIELSYKFALKCTQTTRHRSMFPINSNFRPNMRKKKPYLEPYWRTSRYYNSPISYLSSLLNARSK